MSDQPKTPRTDAVWADIPFFDPKLKTHAKLLEIESDARAERIAELKKELRNLRAATVDDTETVYHENAKLREALARSPMTADGVPIFLGDTVYVENPDSSYFGNEEVLAVQVNYMSNDMGFVGYKGTVTIGACCGGAEWEGGNLDCYASRQALAGKDSSEPTA